jgi:mutator protein MutT
MRSIPSQVIAIAVVEHEGCFLIGQRPPGVALAGLWEFPGGKVEPGESAATAAVRECHEEAGLAVQAMGQYLVHQEQYSHGRLELNFIACRLVKDVPGAAAPPFRWVRREQLSNYEFPTGNRPLLDLLCGRA